MQSYKEFTREAIEYYEKLPQETGELYKRYYINIPFDIKNFENNQDASNEQALSATLDEWNSKFGIKFDVVLGSTDSLANNAFVKIEKIEKLGSMHDELMHKSDEDKYVAYVNARSDRIVTVDVPDDKSANINVLVINSNKPLSAKVMVKLGRNSKLNMFEYYGSIAEKQTSVGIIHELNLGEDSELELNNIHNENSNTLSLVFCKNRIGSRSHMKFNTVYNGAAHTRVRNVIEAAGKESKVEVNEIIFGSFAQKFDIGTYIVNAAPHTNASLESKAALMDDSFCILKGFAKIKKGATKAKSYVHERGILLDKGARINGLPDMSVDENDVKATHSAATSPVDPESVFYLMSKGIDEIGVRKLLVTGFFANNLTRIQNTIMRELSMSLINSKLENKEYGKVPKLDTRNIWVGSSDSTETDMFKGHYKYR